jgi:hypothetical protein
MIWIVVLFAPTLLATVVALDLFERRVLADRPSGQHHEPFAGAGGPAVTHGPWPPDRFTLAPR